MSPTYVIIVIIRVNMQGELEDLFFKQNKGESKSENKGKNTSTNEGKIKGKVKLSVQLKLKQE